MRASDEQRARGDVRRFAQRLARANSDRAVYQIAIGKRVLRGLLTPADAADLAGVSPRTIRRWRDRAATAKERTP